MAYSTVINGYIRLHYIIAFAKDTIAAMEAHRLHFRFISLAEAHYYCIRYCCY